ncbi:peptidoglycan-binding domain-containing protein [Streptacidiphilus pinicola]|nr:peptidoglycan-binding domain-containing protein [Streptacidiphilus pinicola]
MAFPPGDGDGGAVGQGSGSDDETTVLPPLDGDPALVRPYVRAAEGDAPVPEDAPVGPRADSPSAPQVWAADVEHTTVLPPVPPGPGAPPRQTARPQGRPPTPREPQPGPSGPRRGKVLALTGGALALVLIGTGAALLTRPSTGAPAVQAAAPSVDAATASATPSLSTVASPSPSASHSHAPKQSPSPRHRPSPSASRSPSHSASPSSSPQSTSLSIGASGPAVTALQQDLRQLWIDRRQPSGTYDDRTAQDVSTFQSWYNVQGDPAGVYGPNSQAKMAQVLAGNGGNNGNG